MTSKRVLVFEAYPFFSGAQKISLNLCKILKENNYAVTLLLADNQLNVLPGKFGPYVDDVIVAPTNKKLLKYNNSSRWFNPLNFINSFFSGLLPFYFFCFKVFKNKKFDFFYFCDPRGATMILPPAFFFRGKKVLYLQSKNRLKPLISKLLYLIIPNYVVSASTDVADTVPPSSKKIVINYGIDYTQYGGVNKANAVKEIEDITALPYSLGNGPARFLYAGLIKPQKGLHHLIYALGKLKKDEPSIELPFLFILGSTQTDAENLYRENLKQYCLENNLNKNVFWLGFKNNVLEWMSSCDYLIFPTINREKCTFEGFDEYIESTEGSPTVLIESSLCNLFAVAATVTGVNEIITDGANGLKYNPDDELALYNTLKYVLVNRPVFTGFPNKAIFSVETFAAKFLNLFK
jgi:glycosyltransferase involved in cell wall biosynthesis